MTRCLAIACLVAALTGAAAPVPAGDPVDQLILLADPIPPGGEVPDLPPGDPPPGGEVPEAENNSGMTCC